MFEQMERNAGGWFSSKEIKSKVSLIMLAPRPNISLLAFYLLELVLHLNVPTTISKCKNFCSFYENVSCPIVRQLFQTLLM